MISTGIKPIVQNSATNLVGHIGSYLVNLINRRSPRSTVGLNAIAQMNTLTTTDLIFGSHDTFVKAVSDKDYYGSAIRDEICNNASQDIFMIKTELLTTAVKTVMTNKINTTPRSQSHWLDNIEIDDYPASKAVLPSWSGIKVGSSDRAGSVETTATVIFNAGKALATQSVRKAMTPRKMRVASSRQLGISDTLPSFHILVHDGVEADHVCQFYPDTVEYSDSRQIARMDYTFTTSLDGEMWIAFPYITANIYDKVITNGKLLAADGSEVSMTPMNTTVVVSSTSHLTGFPTTSTRVESMVDRTTNYDLIGACLSLPLSQLTEHNISQAWTIAFSNSWAAGFVAQNVNDMFRLRSSRIEDRHVILAQQGLLFNIYSIHGFVATCGHPQTLALSMLFYIYQQMIVVARSSSDTPILTEEEYGVLSGNN